MDHFGELLLGLMVAVAALSTVARLIERPATAILLVLGGARPRPHRRAARGAARAATNAPRYLGQGDRSRPQPAALIGTTGATGEVGGRLARRLADRGVPQRLIVRDRSRAPSLAAAEVSKFGGYGDREGMRRAFRGLSTLFLASAHEAPDRVEQHRAAVDAAVEAGVGRIVYLSFLGAAPDSTFTFARDHFHTEEHIRATGIPFTFSRQSIYLDFLPAWSGPTT